MGMLLTAIFLAQSQSAAAPPQDATQPATTHDPAPVSPVAPLAPLTPVIPASPAATTAAAPPPPPSVPAAPAARAPTAVVPYLNWDDGAGLRTEDRNFNVRIGAQVEVRYDARFTDAAGMVQSNAQVANVRPQLRGNLIRPWIRFFIQPELAGTPRLLDLELDIQPHEAFGVRIGQSITPFSRTFFTPVPLLQFPENAPVNAFFRADRQTGALVYGLPWGGHLEYYLGVYNGNGINLANDNTHMLWLARVVVSPLGAMAYTETPATRAANPTRIAFGLNAYQNDTTAVTSTQVLDPMTGTVRTTTTSTNGSNVTAGADFAVHSGPFMLQIEGYFRHSHVDAAGTTAARDYDSAGGYIQTGYFVVPRALEVALRGGYLDPDTARPDDQSFTGEAQLGYYVLGNHLKFLLRYMALSQGAQAPGITGNTPAGLSHLVTLQSQFNF